MKKILLLAVFLMAIGLVAGVAEDKPLTLSGSVDFSIGDDDLAVAPGPAFSGAKTGAVATFKLGTASDKVEAGVTIGLTPSVALTAGADALPDIADPEYTGTGYEFLQALCDYVYFKFNAPHTYLNDAGAQAAFPTAPINPIVWDQTAGGELIKGTGPWTVTDIDDLTEAPALSTQIRATFDIAVAAIDAVFATLPLNAWVYPENLVLESATALEIAAAKAMQDFYTDYYEYAFGVDTSDSAVASLPVTNAYLKVKKVFGVVDIMAEIEGNDIGVGSMVTSDATSGFDANYGVSLALSEGVMSGLSASVLVTGSDADMAAAASQDYETLIDDTADASEPIWGFQVDAGYATKMFGANVQFGAVDLADLAGTWMLSVMPFVSLADIAGLSLMGEFNLVPGSGFGIGAKLGASIMGIAPSVGFYYKNAAFGGDGSTNDVTGADDLTDDSGLMAEFNSTDAADATALAIAASVDLASLIKMKLVTVSGGYDMLLSGSKNAGWNAGVGLDFAEVLKMPVTLNFSISKWAAEDLLWSAVVGYTYDKLGVKFTLEQTEADVIGWSLAGTVAL